MNGRENFSNLDNDYDLKKNQIFVKIAHNKFSFHILKCMENNNVRLNQRFAFTLF